MADTPLAAGLTQVKLADRAFDKDQFLAGARAAFEMVVAAFAAGDTKSLRPRLANDVYDDFAGAIKEREEATQNLETPIDQKSVVEGKRVELRVERGGRG